MASYRYFSVVENRRCWFQEPCSGRCCTWARSTTSSKLHGAKTLDVFDENEQGYRTMSLFPDDREVRPMCWTASK